MEDNKLIADFMGKEWHKEFFKDVFIISPSNITYKFDTDWNWLMEVVRKIRVLVMEDVTDDLYNSEYWDNITHKLVELEIEAVYNACVEFIKWYKNENN